ncbi:MAG: SDR family oxidoreductase [Bacteroidales bacterium]|jgi:UDP-N-acetylglucosamine 4-epimerase|nr:SDR family oxidoreductase [Bacteroidales bacterium]
MFKNQYHTKPLSALRFLVTGGAGFIGSNIVEYLLQFGAAKVRILDNFMTGHRRNIAPFLPNPAFELHEGDIRTPDACRRAVEGMDFVLHQAALGSVPRSVNDPATTNEVNITGFLNMLIAARDARVKRFVYAASSSTYGDSRELPKTEEHIGRPLSPYAVTKYVNELYADVFARTYSLEAVGLRYFNVFGPRQDPQGAYAAVIPKFVMQLTARQTPVINGSGDNSRDFTYVENVVQANILAALTDNATAVNQVFNVAGGERTTLNQLAQYLKEFMGRHDPEILKIQFAHGPDRLGDIPHSLASIEKAKQLLGYKPLFDFKTGLQQALKWYRENLKS